MLTILSAKSAKPRKRRVGASGDNRVEYDRSGFDKEEYDGDDVRDNKVGVKKRSLVPALVTCYSKDAQRE